MKSGAMRARRGAPHLARCEAGMTLIELVIALGLLALIVTTLAGALGVGVRGAAAVDTRAEQGETLRLAQATVRRFLAQARPARWRTNQEESVAFAGEPDQIAFLAVMPPYPGDGGLFLVRLDVEDTVAGKALVLTRQPTAGDQPGFAFTDAAERTVLLDHVDGVRWSYFGVDAGERQGQWRTQWRGRLDLPKLVRLDLQRTDPRAPGWPTLSVFLPLDPEPR